MTKEKTVSMPPLEEGKQSNSNTTEVVKSCHTAIYTRDTATTIQWVKSMIGTMRDRSQRPRKLPAGAYREVFFRLYIWAALRGSRRCLKLVIGAHRSLRRVWQREGLAA